MILQYRTFTVQNFFALRISRGTTTQSTNIWVGIEQGGVWGWGEATPFGGGRTPQTTESIAVALLRAQRLLDPLSAHDRQTVRAVLATAHLPSAALAAIDMALYDWLGKRVGLPLWQLWGLNRDRISPTSVTIGISLPEAAVERLRHWQQVAEVRVIKVKLGSPSGIEADRVMLSAVLEAAPDDAKVYVDANGGWSLAEAISMSHWLADRGIDYIEQPLPADNLDELVKLQAQSPLPIFVDESCWESRDIPQLCDRVSGINIKLMKCGGLSEALRTIHTARALVVQKTFGKMIQKRFCSMTNP